MAIGFVSCNSESGSGRIITDQRTVSDFQKISVSAGIHVEFKSGPTSIRVEADDNVINYVETTVDNGVLTIGYKDHHNFNNVEVTVFVASNNLNSISSSSGSSVKVVDQLKTDKKLYFEASSSGEISGAVDAPEVEMVASSGAEIKISGRTRNVFGNSSSGASINAFNLLSENANGVASSGGSIDVYASVSVDGNASSGGSVDYRGAAPTIKKNESSGGAVRKDD